MLEEFIRRMCISQYLKKHPVIQENMANRQRYLAVLQYFCEKYAAEDSFAFAMLSLYRSVLLEGQQGNFRYHHNSRPTVANAMDVKQNTKRIWSSRLVLLSECLFLLSDCLFLCAFAEEEKGRKILADIKPVFSPRYHRQMDRFLDTLYHGKAFGKKRDPVAALARSWQENKAYYEMPAKRILVTANMSAGKSTLINAVIGKKVTRTRNDACTAKLHYICSKAFEDGFAYKLDGGLCLHASQAALLEDHPKNSSEKIVVGTYFRLCGGVRHKICFIDTPGVNSSLDLSHREITKAAVEQGDYDTLLYVINGENIGTDDDRRYLEYIANTVKGKRVLFILNKLDRFRQDEDNAAQSIETIREEVRGIGFTDAPVCPVSAYAGLLGKKKLWGETLEEDELDELAVLRRKFREPAFDLSRFYPQQSRAYAQAMIDAEQEETRRKYLQMLHGAGVLALEHMILQ